MVNTSSGEVDASQDFADFLTLHRPETVHELADALRDLVAAVVDTRKGGSLTYTLRIGPDKDGSIRPLLIVDSISVKLPEHDREPSFAFPDKDGHLHDRDPNALFVVDNAT